MKNVRIGNDIHIKWSLLSEGEEFFLEGKDVTIYLSCKYDKRKVTDFSVSGSTVTWTFFGKDQRYTGKYSLELIINDGKENMVTTDVRKFVELVPHCCDKEGTDEPEFIIEDVHIETEVDFVSVLVDEELSDVSSNAISNRAVANALKSKQDVLVDGENLKTINGQSLLGEGNIEIQGGGGGSSITVDSELSETSENPVQNKVVKATFNQFASETAGVVQDLYNNIGELGSGYLQIAESVADKADKTYVDSAITTAITNTLNTPV